MNLRRHYRRFRAWQIRPRRYTDKGMGHHRCNNCGHKFTGNYCPVCGQKATWGRITWGAVRDNVMLLWGMESHSMPYTLFQLMLRPGYLIREYLSGQRQVSYPPVKMLFIVAVIFGIIRQLTGDDSSITNANLEGLKAESVLLYTVINWLVENPGWFILTMTSFFSIPTWIIFRFALRYPHHTFPESVFIQVFLSSLLLICIFLTKISNVFYLLIPFYYYLTYRQLFGYRPWGSLWRLLTCLLVWFLVFSFLFMAAFVYLKPEILEGESLGGSLIELTLITLLPTAILLAFGYLIGKRTRKHIKYQSQTDNESPKMVK